MALNGIAIVGMSQKCKVGIPFTDKSWQVWGLPWDKEHWAQYDALFEIHTKEMLETVQFPHWPGYKQRLEQDIDPSVTLFMREPCLPNATQYPLDSVTEIAGNRLDSSVAYMMAMAIWMMPDRIGVYGVDMASDDEYAHQRPNMMYLIGLARGLGISVVLPEQSSLNITPKLYGGMEDVHYDIR